jgi:hypothetical protein
MTMRIFRPCVVLAATLLIVHSALAADPWQPADGPLKTRWTDQVSPDHAHPEYPRPQMVRDSWVNLNGLWDYSITAKDAAAPETFDGQILVPFPVQSALSGVMKAVTPEQRLWYRRMFTSDLASDQCLLLHFQAVDWHTEVFVNGKKVGEHQGGYDPFSFDITSALEPGGEQQIVVSVWDPTDKGPQPRGKQTLNPRGIWYTAVTGIWQTVWLEKVPAASIQALKIVPDVDASRVHVTVDATESGESTEVKLTLTGVTMRDEATDLEPVSVTAKPGQQVSIPITEPKLWSPDSPWLYQFRVDLLADGAVIDSVASYFGMRKIEVKQDEAGRNRLWLNGQVLFQLGPLDQGWWPDGLYTAATDEALEYDIIATRQLGYNMARKHVKVEPARWYYHCDRLGLLVWQDMPSGGGPGETVGDGETFPRSQFEVELKAMLDAFHNHPCIVMWVPFNEGWGQHRTESIVAWMQQYDSTRPINEASGWTDTGSGDVKDIHSYPGPAMPKLEDDRVAVLGEFGGLGLPVEGHLWWDKRNWGYRTFSTLEQLRSSYDQLIHKLRPMIGRGLAAAVYTQTSDCEGEVNGLMTYDRDVIKFQPEQMRALHAPLYKPQPVILIKPVVPTSEKQAQTWRYTTQEPNGAWYSTGFDDSSWQAGPGGFGTKSTPGAVVGTQWNSDEIWLRRTFQLNSSVSVEHLQLRIHHDEDAQVYINGVKALDTSGYLTDYLESPLSPAAREALQAGENTLAVHCRQTDGGQFIDVGLVEVVEKPAKGQ